jgi:hypothetical protein
MINRSPCPTLNTLRGIKMATRKRPFSFENGKYVVCFPEHAPNKSNYIGWKVRAKSRISHGDWKTQSVRDEFMGMEVGDVGTLEYIWLNADGWQANVKVGDKSCDVPTNKLTVVSYE